TPGSRERVVAVEELGDPVLAGGPEERLLIDAGETIPSLVRRVVDLLAARVRVEPGDRLLNSRREWNCCLVIGHECCRQDWMRTDRHHSPRTLRRICMLTRSDAG
ncbi:MAG: hypothetical protein WCE63_11705, partial [Acidobacteriaceae bacterium]